MAKNDKKLLELRLNYEKACQAYVNALYELWNVDAIYCWWVGDRVGVNVLVVNTEHCLSMDDVIFCVENEVSYDEFLDNEDYNSWAIEFGVNCINIKHWHMGNHGAPEEERERLTKLKKDFEDAVDDCKSKF